MAGRGCDVSEADLNELMAGRKDQTEITSRPGESLSREEKRGMGSWASRAGARGPGKGNCDMECCKCHERAAKASPHAGSTTIWSHLPMQCSAACNLTWSMREWHPSFHVSPQVTVRQNEAVCGECLESNVMAKVQL